MKINDWHLRFLQQAAWSHSARQHFCNISALGEDIRILDVGCGTGAVLQEQIFTRSNIIGIDINHAYLEFAARIHPHGKMVQADGYLLPFSGGTFDVVFCHYLLLWLTEPLQMLTEMMRVTRPGGWLCIFAEPDYSARIDYPHELQQLGRYQNQSLHRQGVRLDTGRHLPGWLQSTGLIEIQYGILGGFWNQSFDAEGWRLEWETLFSDLADWKTQKEMEAYRQIDEVARKENRRVLFVPTFFAWGRKAFV